MKKNKRKPWMARKKTDAIVKPLTNQERKEGYKYYQITYLGGWSTPEFKEII